MRIPKAEKAGFEKPIFCNSLNPMDLERNPITISSLSSFDYLGGTGLFLGHFDPQQGQIRDKFNQGVEGFDALPFWLLFAVVLPIFPLPDDSYKKVISPSKILLLELVQKTFLEVQKIHQVYADQFGINSHNTVGAVYARFSTKYQDSIGDQVQKCLEFALKEKTYVPLENIHYDLATKGMKMNRPGLSKIKDLLKAKAINVLLVFATNRLSRKLYKALQLIEEEVIENGIDCVFISQGIDTRKKENWRLHLSFHSMIDEMNVNNYSDNIRAAQERLFSNNLVTGSITFGYEGVPTSGKMTRRDKASRELQVDKVKSEIVQNIFKWYAEEKLTKLGIIRKLEAQYPKFLGKHWSYTIVSYILKNERYIGKWSYGLKKSVWNSKKDYVSQILREEPLKTEQKNDLRIISDELWHKTQTRLNSNLGYLKGRKPLREDYYNKPKALNGFFYCPTHHQSLLVGGYYGKYYFCPQCVREPADKRPLFTHLSRRIAHAVMCQVIASFIQKIQGMADKVYECLLLNYNKPPEEDEKNLFEMKKTVRLLTTKVQHLMANLGETDEDIAESNHSLKQMRHQRSQLNANISAIETGQKILVPPSKEELLENFKNLESLLLEKTHSNDPKDQTELRNIFETLIDGKITLHQNGNRKSKGGHLEGSFKFSLEKLLPSETELEQFDELVTVQFTEKPQHELNFEEDAKKVLDLYNKDYLNCQIASQLGFCRSKITKLLQKAHKKLGLAYKDGRTRRASQLKKVLKETIHSNIAEDAKLLYDQNLPVLQIASRLNCSAPTVDKALDFWYKTRDMKRPSSKERNQKLLAQIKDLYNEGKQFQEIGKLVGYCARSVSVLLRGYYKSLGLKLPDGRCKR